MNKINEILKKKRKILGLTQKDVADKAHTSLRSYQRFESGERDIMTCSFKLACGIVEALGMDIDSFYHGNYSFREGIYLSEDGLRYGKNGKLVKENVDEQHSLVYVSRHVLGTFEPRKTA